MTTDVRDTRETAMRSRKGRTRRPALARGESEELRIFMMDALHLPRETRRFSVTFTVGEPMVVSVEYVSREMCAHQNEE
jgi:hypothetical protein